MLLAKLFHAHIFCQLSSISFYHFDSSCFKFQGVSSNLIFCDNCKNWSLSVKLIFLQYCTIFSKFSMSSSVILGLFLFSKYILQLSNPPLLLQTTICQVQARWPTVSVVLGFEISVLVSRMSSSGHIIFAGLKRWSWLGHTCLPAWHSNWTWPDENRNINLYFRLLN